MSGQIQLSLELLTRTSLLRWLLVAISIKSTTTSTFYDEDGNLSAVERPNGTTTQSLYRRDDSIKSLTNLSSSGDILSYYLYNYDANGNITSENNTTYTYDELNRLKTWYKPSTTITTTYNYDKVGNLTEVKEGATPIKNFTYNAASQITNSGYIYDDNGNLTADGTYTYIYDAENRLTEVKQGTNSLATYTYDADGKRLSKTTGANTLYYHYDNWNVISETDASNNVLARYDYAGGYAPVSMVRGGQTYCYIYNGHGDVVSLTNSSGQVVNTYTYDPYGNILSANETVENPYRYAGYRYDSETGLYYLQARYYKPDIYRFLTKDPDGGDVGEPLTLNPYLYCADNPVNFVDPDGQIAVADDVVIVTAVCMFAMGVVVVRYIVMQGGGTARVHQARKKAPKGTGKNAKGKENRYPPGKTSKWKKIGKRWRDPKTGDEWQWDEKYGHWDKYGKGGKTRLKPDGSPFGSGEDPHDPGTWK